MGTWFRGFDRAPIFNGWLLHFRKQQTAYEGCSNPRCNPHPIASVSSAAIASGAG